MFRPDYMELKWFNLIPTLALASLSLSADCHNASAFFNKMCCTIDTVDFVNDSCCWFIVLINNSKRLKCTVSGHRLEMHYVFKSPLLG